MSLTEALPIYTSALCVIVFFYKHTRVFVNNSYIIIRFTGLNRQVLWSKTTSRYVNNRFAVSRLAHCTYKFTYSYNMWHSIAGTQCGESARGKSSSIKSLSPVRCYRNTIPNYSSPREHVPRVISKCPRYIDEEKISKSFFTFLLLLNSVVK